MLSTDPAPRPGHDPPVERTHRLTYLFLCVLHIRGRRPPGPGVGYLPSSDGNPGPGVAPRRSHLGNLSVLACDEEVLDVLETARLPDLEPCGIVDSDLRPHIARRGKPEDLDVAPHRA